MLTKSNFIKFLECSCQLWLAKQRPDLLPAVDATLQKVFDDGNQVDVLAQKLYPGGVEIKGFNEAGARNTKKAMDAGAEVLFQPTFLADGLTCRSDILVKNGAAWDLHEVKSSTAVKESHVFDAAFQRVCLELSGVPVGRAFIVHINNQYVREGDVDPREFFTSEDVTDRVLAALPLARKQINRARKTLKLTEEAGIELLKSCSKPDSCQFLPLYIGTIPHETVYAIAPALPKGRLKAFLERGLLKPDQMPTDLFASLGAVALPNPSQEPVVAIDKAGIARELGQLEYPLYFLDYETHYPAVPAFDGYKPYQQTVFQYSVHILPAPDAELEHVEYLHQPFEDPSPAVAAALAKDIGPKGSVIVWNARFEAGRNEEIARMVPEYAVTLRSINERMYDLMLVVRGGFYADSRFGGSASLKRVLPVVVPELSYADLNIQEGNAASRGWAELTDPRTPPTRKRELKRDMLAYCALDTLAMVELYRKFLAATQ